MSAELQKATPYLGHTRTLIALGRYDAAITDLEAAIRERPSSRELREQLIYARSEAKT